MKVILLKDVKGLGKTHDVVDVKDGYAKNYLIKNKLAVSNTTNAQVTLNKDLDILAKQEVVRVKEASELKHKLEQLSLHFTLKTNKGNAFGSISHKMIIDELHDKYQLKIDKFMVDTNDEKNLGLGRHLITINIYKKIVAKLPINIEEE
ncbi:MAG: 50S ribosomal protein L9 [Mycoplasmataceae bacterium]|jgi:large subunit ribosomal protein L9|nr:50S ribosomal protein L9 [Mycoplasmataceae bacterium]